MTSTGQPGTGLDDHNKLRVLKGPEVPPLQWPHFSDPGSASSPPHCSYHSLGHCLRTNIFPGVPVVWTSMVKESYVMHPRPAPPTSPQPWHGRRTDAMMRWTERNIVNQKLNKALKELEKRGVK